MALVTTFMTVPLVNWIYPKQYHKVVIPESKNEPDFYSSTATLDSKPNNMTILVCLPSMRIVPAVMNLLQMMFQSPNKVDFYALRLVELGQRLSKVMRATDASQTMQLDPVL